MAVTAAPPASTDPRAALAHRQHALLALAVGAAALVGALYALAVLTPLGQLAGDAAIGGGLQRSSRAIAAGAELLNLVGRTTLAIATLAIAGVGLARGGLPLAVASGGAILLANVATQALKRFVFQRPALLDVTDPFGSHNSYPSGHATIAMSLVLGLLMVLPSAHDRRLALAGWFTVALMGAAMIAQGWHRPSDAVAGYLVATASASLMSALALAGARRLPGHDPAAHLPRNDAHALWRRVLPAALALIGLAGAGLFSAVAWRTWGDLTPVDLTAAYWSGIAFLALAAAGCIAAFLRALGGADLATPGWLPGVPLVR